MKNWTVEIRPGARRDLRNLEHGPREAALEILADLAEDGPHLDEGPAEMRPIELRANPKLWRIRFHSNYRLIYQVSNAENRIIVTRIKVRSEAYKGMKH